jgi:WD40 repeat protein
MCNDNTVYFQPPMEPHTDSHQRNRTEKNTPLCLQPVKYVQCHNSEINDVCVSSTGDHFITAGSDASVNVTQMSSGRTVLYLKHSNPVICLDVCVKASNGQGQFCSGSSDGICRIWNLDSGSLRLQFTGHSNKVYACKMLGKYGL